MSKTNAGGYTFISKVPAVIVAIEGASMKGIMKATQHVTNKVKENLSNKPKRTGKTYKVPGTGKVFINASGKKQTRKGTAVYYKASAPGEYPALRLGDLRSSVHWKIHGGSGIVYTKLEHGAILEDAKDKRTEAEGTRKWLMRTFDEEENMVKEIIYGAGNPASREWF